VANTLLAITTLIASNGIIVATYGIGVRWGIALGSSTASAACTLKDSHLMKKTSVVKHFCYGLNGCCAQ